MSRQLVSRLRRRVLAPTAAALVLAVSSTGCGVLYGSHGGPHTVVIGVRSHFVTQMQQVAKAYHKVDPDTTIRIESLPDDGAAYLQRLVVGRLGNNLPDVVESFDTYINQVNDNNIVRDLTPYFAKGEGLNEKSFAGDFLDAYRPTGEPQKVLGMPVSDDAMVMFVNDKLFRKAGVPLPKPGWSTEDMYEAARRISEAGRGSYYGLLANSGGLPNPAIYNPMLKAAGTYVYDEKTNTTGIGSPAAVKVWKKLLEPQLGKYAAPYSDTIGAGQLRFEQNRLAMYPGARVAMPNTQAAFGNKGWHVVPMPEDRGKTSIGGGSYGLSITTGAENPDGAWSFLKWFYTTDGGLEAMSRTGAIVPPTEDALAHGTWRGQPAPKGSADVFADAAQKAVMAPVVPQRAQSVLENQLQAALQKVLLQHVSVEKAFGAAADAVQKTLDESGTDDQKQD